jgi:hypothetical protein
MLIPTGFPLLLFVESFLVLWVSARLGSRFGKGIEDVREEFSVILTATLTLLGLILGFTFSMAVSRYDQRKLAEEKEANAIGTEYLRTELLPDPEGADVRRLLREYLEQRILFFQTRDSGRLRRIDAATRQLQTKLWESVKTPSLAQQKPLTVLVASGMNDVLDSQGFTQAAWWNRIPVEAWALLGIIGICSNLMVGLYIRRMRSKGILLAVLPAIASVAFFLIADIDSPRGGLIHVKPENLISAAQSLGS